MGKRKVDPLKKREAIARVLTGSTTYRTEAKRLGVSKSTLHEAAQDLKPDNDQVDQAAGPSETPLEAARKAAGLAKDPKAPLTTDELKLASPQAIAMEQEYCLATIASAKLLGTCGGALIARVPLTDERVFQVAQIGKPAVEGIRAAAPELSPLLKKYLPEGASLVGLAIVLLFDCAASFMQMRDLSLEYRKKRDEEEAARKKGPVQAAA